MNANALTQRLTTTTALSARDGRVDFASDATVTTVILSGLLTRRML